MTLEKRKLADDCFVHDKDRLRHDEALSILNKRIETIAETGTVKLDNANGKVLASSLKAPRNIPAFDNAAVDGYAFAHRDYEPTGGFFPLVARVAAGDDGNVELPGFGAARIFTGAPMPIGADTVAMQEDCEPHSQDGSEFVAIPDGLKRGANCRLAGEDVKLGETIAEAGARLRPQDLAAIASTGVSEIDVYKPLKVALFSSGNEILRPGEPFESGKVYDANQPMLSALLEKLGFEVTSLGIVPDKSSEVEGMLEKCANSYDVIISSGGASKGEEDHFIDALDKLGKRHLWQLAVKPGRPMCFGQIGNTVCFTLPGNPVAAFVCFSLYVRPSLLKLGGASWSVPQRFPTKAGFSIRSKPDRREFLRGFLGRDENGNVVLRKFDRDGSGLISGLRQSSGLIEIPEEATKVESGDLLGFIPYSELGIA